MLLLDTNILIDVLRGEKASLEWLDLQQPPCMGSPWRPAMFGISP
jgi:predicted nucleic acid-binding protein